MSEGKKVVEALVAGGQATAGPPLGPALGPLGVNVLAIVNKINETKEFEVTVGTPTTAALIVSELKVEKGSGSPKAQKVGNLDMAQAVKIAKMKSAELLSTNLKAAIKEVLGSCVSMGVTVDGKDPKDVQKEINEGKYDSVLGQAE